jgi:hypothetical protein
MHPWRKPVKNKGDYHMSILYHHINVWRGRQIDKWVHYFPIYEKHFERFVNRSPRVLEIGIDHGGSLQMWARYFGPGAEIIGVDVNPAAMFSEEQITTHVFDQTDPKIADLGPFDVIIDDGSHRTRDQAESFVNLFPVCRGVYLIEDCHTEYPHLPGASQLMYRYPWVIVVEQPRRIIRGEPTRVLREDEAAARKLFGP